MVVEHRHVRHNGTLIVSHYENYIVLYLFLFVFSSLILAPLFELALVLLPVSASHGRWLSIRVCFTFVY